MTAANNSRILPTYGHLAHAIAAFHHCQRTDNAEWLRRHRETVEQIARDVLPSGSGIDAGCKVDLDRSHADKLVITTAYHHMNEGGMYDGWTEHTITVTPSFIGGITVRISGRDRNEIKDYLADVFRTALTETVEHTYDRELDQSSFRVIRDRNRDRQ